MGAAAWVTLWLKALARVWQGRDEATQRGRNGKLGQDGVRQLGVVGLGVALRCA
jgi:hypothetical protein